MIYINLIIIYFNININIIISFKLLEEPGGGVQMYDNIVPTVVKPITMETYTLDYEQVDISTTFSFY